MPQDALGNIQPGVNVLEFKYHRKDFGEGG
jgi:hypothetical protein